MSLTLEL